MIDRHGAEEVTQLMKKVMVVLIIIKIIMVIIMITGDLCSGAP